MSNEITSVYRPGDKVLFSHLNSNSYGRVTRVETLMRWPYLKIWVQFDNAAYEDWLVYHDPDLHLVKRCPLQT